MITHKQNAIIFLYLILKNHTDEHIKQNLWKKAPSNYFKLKNKVSIGRKEIKGV